MRAFKPQAAETFEEGERLAADGRLEEALVHFDKARTDLPNASLPHRRYCEVMTALGRGPQALHECLTALEIMHTKFAVRAVVRALVTGPDAPTMQNVSQALWLLGAERENLPPRFELSSALCDIAERIGDGPMLQHCTQELLGLAPDAPETGQALAMLDGRCPYGRFWAGWLFLAAALLGTLAHALRRAMAHFTRRGAAWGAAATLIAVIQVPARAVRADPLPPEGMISKWPINDNDPEQSIPTMADRNKDPLNFGYWLQDLIAKAEGASKHGDHTAAIKYYRAMAKAVPDRAVAYSHLCQEYEATGEKEQAIASCGAALLYEGVTVADYAHYVRLVLSRPALTEADPGTLQGVLDTLKADPKAHPLFEELECAVGARIPNVADLADCVPVLVAKSPNDPRTIYYQWALAMEQGRLEDARKLLERAQKTGLDQKTLQAMELAILDAKSNRFLGAGLFVVAAGLLVAASLFGLRYLRGRRASSEAAPAGAAST